MRADGRVPGALPSWRSVVEPRPEVCEDALADAEFAVDVARVHSGRAPAAVGDARAFFERTHPTAGLRRLLAAAAQRVAGRGGVPVAALRTGFGGGKSHALVALHHLLTGSCAGADVPWLAADIPARGAVRAAVLCGTDHSPAEAWPCPALGGRPVRTLWGELAAQLGGPAGFARVAAADASGIPPAAGTLAELFDAGGPCAVLLDEPLPYLRALHGHRATAGGTFDGNLTFLHNLTEAARRSRAGLLVAALPASAAEAGGEGGREAAAALHATFGRLETVWRPAEAAEGLRIAQRRLFRPAPDGGAREAVCAAFAAVYAEGGAAFPPESRAPEYTARLRAAYPLHPELVERLQAGWAPLPAFQGTRGVLRLLAAAVAALWAGGAEAPLVQPGDLPLEAPGVRGRLTAALGAEWEDVLDADVAGDGAGAAACDRDQPRFGAAAAARRVARAIFLGTPEGGLERARLNLGVLRPGEPPALAGDALDALRRRLGHLHGDAARATFHPRANLVRRAADRAAAIDAPAVEAEIRRRLEGCADRRDREARSVFGAVHALDGEAAPPDRPVSTLALLPAGAAHLPGAGPSPALALAAQVMAGWTRHPNLRLFLAADGRDVPRLQELARSYLAWASLRDREPGPDAAEGLRAADQALALRLGEAYRWLIVPTQEARGPVRLEALEVLGGGDPVARAAGRAVRDQIVLSRWSPTLLRLTLDRWLWPGRPHVPVAWVWECLTRYPYLPRLAGWHVLAETIAAGAAGGEHFAHAEGVGADGGYIGLRRGLAPELRRPAGLLVRSEAAGVGGCEPRPAGGETPPAAAGGPAARFRGHVALNPDRAAAEAARVVEEVVRHLAATPGCQVTLTLQVVAHAPGGLPARTLRLVRENAAALRFGAAEFEEG